MSKGPARAVLSENLTSSVLFKDGAFFSPGTEGGVQALLACVCAAHTLVKCAHAVAGIENARVAVHVLERALEKGQATGGEMSTALCKLAHYAHHCTIGVRNA